MSIKRIPRQKPYCTLDDFMQFLRMMFYKKLIKGDFILEFETAFAKVYDARYALAASSCRSIFSLILDGLGILEGDEVILPAFNLSAFPKILVHKKIKPIFIDIDENTFNIDPNKIEQNITPRTKAIIAVHLFGNCCEIEKICAIAKKHHLFVIEDCANAFMTKYKGQFVGTFGDIACFSLSHSKDIPTFGGGILITNNGELFERILHYFNKDYRFPNMKDMMKMFVKNFILKVMTASLIFSVFIYPVIFIFSLFRIDLIAHFIEEKDVMIAGICKRRFTNFQAYIGINKLKENNQMQRKRIEIANQFNAALSEIRNIKVPKVVQGGSHAYWNYTILTPDRASLVKKLILYGIDTKKINQYDCNNYTIFKEHKRDCPSSQKISKMILAIPNYHYLKENEVDFIVNTFAMLRGV